MEYNVSVDGRGFEEKERKKKENGKTKVSCCGVYEFLHDNKHH